MKVLIVVGARPNFMKAAPIVAAIADYNRRTLTTPQDFGTPVETIQRILLHTGQHYDERMSGSFFTDLSLPQPDISLGVGSGSHAVQTAEIMLRFEVALLAERPDFVVVVGDVNSTVACAVVTAKIAFDPAGTRPRIAHVEAGLRSFDRSMPEELNRVLTDHVSDLLFVTEESGLENLRNEGIPPDRMHFVGNTMIDSLVASTKKADSSTVLADLGLRTSGGTIADYALLTLHRPSNVDDRDAFLSILSGLDELATRCPIVFPVHPRTRRRIDDFGLSLGTNGARIVPVDPLGYLDFLAAMKHARVVVTDSGGIQEETTCLGVPCVTVRENTERPVTVLHGTNIIAGTTAPRIKAAIRQQLESPRQGVVPERWDGRAAPRIVDALVQVHTDHRDNFSEEPPMDANSRLAAVRAS